MKKIISLKSCFSLWETAKLACDVFYKKWQCPLLGELPVTPCRPQNINISHYYEAVGLYLYVRGCNTLSPIDPISKKNMLVNVVKYPDHTECELILIDYQAQYKKEKDRLFLMFDRSLHDKMRHYLWTVDHLERIS